MSTELITIEPPKAMDVFTKENGVDPILEAIKKEVAKFVPDISTKKGREDVASLAYKVAKTKTYLDNLGATLVEDMKKQVKTVDGSRKKIRDYLDELKEETRKPLTDWENAEKDRVKRLEDAVSEIMQLGNVTVKGTKLTLPELKANLAKLSEQVIGGNYQEFKMRAEREKEQAIESLKREISDREKYEAEQAELKRLREEAAQREIKEREEKIAREAAEKTRRELEEETRRQREQEEILRKEKEAKEQVEFEEKQRKQAEEFKRIREEAERADKERQEAEQRQADAEKSLAEEKERSRIASVKADEERKLAEERAAEGERIRQEKIKEQEEVARLARERDLSHKKKINNEALRDLMETAGLMEPQARVVITAIAKGLVNHIKISY